MRLVRRHEIIEGCKLYKTAGEEELPRYAYIPHYYTCPVLRSERRAWAILKARS